MNCKSLVVSLSLLFSLFLYLSVCLSVCLSLFLAQCRSPTNKQNKKTKTANNCGGSTAESDDDHLNVMFYQAVSFVNKQIKDKIIPLWK